MERKRRRRRKYSRKLLLKFFRAMSETLSMAYSRAETCYTADMLGLRVCGEELDPHTGDRASYHFIAHIVRFNFLGQYTREFSHSTTVFSTWLVIRPPLNSTHRSHSCAARPPRHSRISLAFVHCKIGTWLCRRYYSRRFRSK